MTQGPTRLELSWRFPPDAADRVAAFACRFDVPFWATFDVDGAHRSIAVDATTTITETLTAHDDRSYDYSATGVPGISDYTGRFAVTNDADATTLAWTTAFVAADAAAATSMVTINTGAIAPMSAALAPFESGAPPPSGTVAPATAGPPTAHVTAGQYLPPRPDALARIDHVVVLMLENRSFDSLLGWLYDEHPPPRGQQFDGLRRDMWCPLANVDADGIAFTEKVAVHRNGEAITHGHGKAQPTTVNFRLPGPDPGEGFVDTNEQLFGHTTVADLYPPDATCQGFVENYVHAMLYGTYSFGDVPTDPRAIMTTYTPEQVPVLSALAREFAVCDGWHASVPSQTLPNRDFVHAATSDGQVNNQPQGLCDAETVFNRLQAAAIPWRVYSGSQGDRLFSLTRTIMTSLHDAALDANFVSMTQFAQDAASGDLPGYAFIEPQFHAPGQNDQHPNADIRPGDALIADVYRALSSSPAWAKTLLVITYDEHGGCYDHVAPPSGARAPDARRGPEGEMDPGAPGQCGFRFNRFGVRVPAVVVSPLIEAGTVARPAGYTPFDHTSVVATVLRRFGLEHLTARDAQAPDLGCLLTRDVPRTDVPAVTPLEWDSPADGGENDLQQIVAQVLARLTGVQRPSEQDLTTFIHDAYEQHFGPAPATAG